MTETVYEAYNEKSKESSSDAPVLGQGSNTADRVTANGTVVRYFVGTMTNESDVLMLQELMTRSMKCRDQLNEIGDVLVINEQGTFDKEGCYHVVVKYIEMVEDSDAAKSKEYT